MKHSLPSMMKQQELIETQKRAFKCLKCSKYAKSPVLTHCGHIFCWQCLYKSTQTLPQCPQCKQPWNLQDCYPVYTDHHEQQQAQHENQQQQPHSQNQLSSHQNVALSVPSRPVAKHRQKIMNPNMIGAGLPLAANSLPSNINMGKMLAGHVYLSPVGINAFSSIQEGVQADQDYKMGQKYKIRMHIVIICTILMIVYFLVK